MPIQINEIIIRAVVNPAPGSSGQTTPECPPSANSGSDADLNEKILEIIKEKLER
jgi:hypothetical protein